MVASVDEARVMSYCLQSAVKLQHSIVCQGNHFDNLIEVGIKTEHNRRLKKNYTNIGRGNHSANYDTRSKSTKEVR